MERKEIFEKIEELFIDLLDDEDIRISEETSMENLEEWDSLFHMTLMASLGEDFSIELTTEDIVKAKDVKAIIDIVTEKM